MRIDGIDSPLTRISHPSGHPWMEHELLLESIDILIFMLQS